MQCVAECCRVLQSVAVNGNVLQCVAILQDVAAFTSALQCVAVYSIVLQRGSGVSQCVVVWLQ